ncbi:hypothetical protein JTE90_011554 [Oedothorax gibbosus]|uniref:HTH psq-type domain-containing protein n=1 Tax=Oedothorax gibbosus TaxID=931172 RepID=A0AAV6UI50_9ARAC|nr:hypothetical protein JTE90_011554 [Oedothorax gibbosus]
MEVPQKYQRKKGEKPQRIIPPYILKEAVEKVLDGTPCHTVSNELGLSMNTLRRYVRKIQDGQTTNFVSSHNARQVFNEEEETELSEYLEVMARMNHDEDFLCLSVTDRTNPEDQPETHSSTVSTEQASSSKANPNDHPEQFSTSILTEQSSTSRSEQAGTSSNSLVFCVSPEDIIPFPNSGKRKMTTRGSKKAMTSQIQQPTPTKPPQTGEYRSMTNKSSSSILWATTILFPLDITSTAPLVNILMSA